ncbi:MAG: helix-turn-helix transcriptional regulator [Nitratireductor sp.]|nr:helix-turn-helix transcriptional regulator [Nitratireductor sp.]
MNTHERIPAGDHAAGAGINICSTISDMLSRIGDKWTIETVTALGKGPKRFNELRREMGEISQKMLSTTLRRLERDGFVSRHVLPTTPPQVSYTLTRLGEDLSVPICAIVSWTVANAEKIEQARSSYDARAAKA